MKTCLPSAAALILALAMPYSAKAAAPDATAFVANVRQQVAFLEQSSRLAASKGAHDAIRTYAAGEAREQAVAFAALDAWSDPTQQVAFAGSLTGTPAIDSATPLASDAVLTGRSAAVDATIGAVPTDAVAAAPGVIVMPWLDKLSGPAFDTLYKTTQAASLRVLADTYQAYAAQGTDATLRTMALRELPLLRARLSEIDQL